MQKALVILLLCLLGLIWTAQAPVAWAKALQPSPTAGVQVDTVPLDLYLEELHQESQGTLPRVGVGTFVAMMFRRGAGLDIVALLKGLLRYFFEEVMQQSGLLGKLLVLGVAAALLEHVGRAFRTPEVARFAQTVVYLALAAVALASFGEAAAQIRSTVDQLTGLMEAILPLLTTLLAALGSFSTIAFLRPAMLVTANLLGVFVANWVIPALFLAAVVEQVALLTGYRLQGIAQLLRQIGTVSLGIGLTFFLGVVSIFRLAGPIADSIFLRSGKFLANAFVPVVGKLFSDATEVVFGSTFLLKNAIGLAGLFAVLLATLLPVLKLLAVVFIYRLAAALLGPVGAAPLADTLGSLAQNLVLVAVALGTLAFMFYIAMTLVFAGGRGLVG